MRRQFPLKEVIKPTQFANIDVVLSNLSLGKLESELLAEQDSHSYLSDKLDEMDGYYNILLLDYPPTYGLPHGPY